MHTCNVDYKLQKHTFGSTRIDVKTPFVNKTNTTVGTKSIVLYCTFGDIWRQNMFFLI